MKGPKWAKVLFAPNGVCKIEFFNTKMEAQGKLDAMMAEYSKLGHCEGLILHVREMYLPEREK